MAGRDKRWARALITGASAGIGEAFARELATRKTDLVLVARRVHLLEGLATDLSARHGIDIEVLPADLTDRDDLARVESRLVREEMSIDLVVNNAGGSDQTGRGAIVDHAPGAIEKQALLNAVAVLRLTRAAAARMAARGRGDIIQVSAGVAFYPVPYGATYAASKAFVNSFSKAVDYELRPSGVKVTVVCPGFTRTDAPARNGFTEANVPRSLWSDPEDVVRVALDATKRRKAVASPGTINKLNAFVGRHFPTTMMRIAGAFTKDSATVSPRR